MFGWLSCCLFVIVVFTSLLFLSDTSLIYTKNMLVEHMDYTS